MYEYLFFNEKLLKRFELYLGNHRIPYSRSIENSYPCIQIDEAIEDNRIDGVDDFYDDLLDKQAEITSLAEPDEIHLVGIQFKSINGEPGQVKLKPEIVNRLHQVFSFSEIQQLVQTIADATSTPNISPLCKKDPL